MYKRGDFHIHSTYSDGGLTPKEIVNLAKKRDIDIISITDHNTTSGIDEAIKFGKENNICVVPGVELSTRYEDCRVHLLGYFKDNSYSNELLIELLYLVKKGNIKEIKSIFNGSIDFCGYKDKICVKTGIDILKFFGAIVVLAHPVLICKKNLINILSMNFDGIEAKYFKNTEKDTKYFINYANKNKLIYTAGSDFHNYIEYYRIHGMLGDVYLNQEEIYIFLKKLEE